MIAVFEPSARGASHEKVNSAFLSCVQLAYPGEQIRFFASPSHIAAIQKVASIDGEDLSAVEYAPLAMGDPTGLPQFLRYRGQIRTVFEQALAAGSPRVLFLSASPLVQFQAKRLLAEPRYSTINICIVLHAAFEQIATDQVTPLPIRNAAPPRNVSLIIRERGWLAVLRAAVRRIARGLNLPATLWTTISDRLFQTHAIMEWRHSKKVRYIALSPHIVENARKYIDVDKMNIGVVTLPTSFRPYGLHFSTDYPRFAVFGYGNSPMLSAVLQQLDERRITRPYEIRIIGMDNRGTEGFANINAISPGKFMDRLDMERHVSDIDMFLILYDRSRYRLSCSNAVLEALSYFKPILHFTNDCVNFFNRPDTPIGYEVSDVAAYADRMADLIENFSARRSEFETFGANIARQRERYRLDNLAMDFKVAFEGSPRLR
jgi:hypothetical protein